MDRVARTTILTTLTAALVLGSLASPAAAAGIRTVPVGEGLYAITCPYYSDIIAQTPDLQLLSIAESTAVSTTIGSGTTTIADSMCAGSASLDATTGTVYAVTDEDQDFNHLITIDLVTGESTFVADITGGPTPDDVESIAIGLDGVAYAIIDSELGFLDLTTGAFTYIADTIAEVYGFTVDPTTGLFYVANTIGELYSIDVSDGSTVFLGQLAFVSGSDLYSLTMDSAGVFWAGLDISSVDEYQMELHSFTLADPTGSDDTAGILSVGAIFPYSEALVIGPAYVPPVVASPAADAGLAATGIDAGAIVAGGAALLAIGAVLAFIARRRETSGAH